MTAATTSHGATTPQPDGRRTLGTHWQTHTAAAVILGLAAIGIWIPQLGLGVLWAVPVLTFAILVMVRAIEPQTPLQSRALLLSWIGWVPLAALLAGEPSAIANPFVLIDGIVTLLRGAGGTLGLAAWLALTGTCWILGAAQAIRPGRGAAAAAFVFLTVPFAFAFTVSRTGDAGWYGGALLAAALLWATRGTLRATLPAAIIVALIGSGVAAAIGPTERKIPNRTAQVPTGGPGGIGDQNRGGAGGDQQQPGQPGESGQPGQQPQPEDGASGSASTPQRILNDRANYDSLTESDTPPVVDFEIRADRPALWRMQAQEAWDGRGWSVAPTGRELPQPAAERTRTAVTLRTLGDRRVIGAGRIVKVPGGPSTTEAAGEARAFTSQPRPGMQYDVVSEHVSADLAALAQIPLPAPADYPAETLVWPSLPATVPLDQRIQQLPRNVADSGWGEVFKTAQRLSAGETTQLGVVRNVAAYLHDPSNFSYSLTIPKTSPQPLVTFLTDTRVGYCQHFAGAAALLLRLAGVPTRVVVGYATGERRPDRYVVRGSDAHAWIEVYFEGYGWVPFNPTPGEAAAQVAQEIDPTAPPPRRGALHFNSREIGVIILGLLAVVGVVFGLRRWRRRSGRGLPMGELLLRVVPGSTGPATTLRSIQPELARIGPATAALGHATEQARFAPGSAHHVRRPRWLLWRTLVRDVGPFRASWLMVFGAPRPESRADGSVVVAGTAPALGETASVAPPTLPG